MQLDVWHEPVITDVFGKFTDRYSFTPAAWWILFYGAIATPLTALAGWMWATDIQNATGGQSGSIGVGAEAQLSGLSGASMNYDAGDFHVGAFLGFHDPGGDNDDALTTEAANAALKKS